MFMRVQHPNILPATAFPKFIVTYLPAPLAGVTLATILISSLATGAGLTLGVSTIFAKDLYKSWLCVKATDGQQLKFMRWVILGIGLITFIVTTLLADAIILNFGFASMLLRAGPIFVPLVMTLYFPKHLTPTVGMVAIVGGPSASILWMLLGLPMQSAIFVGLVTSLLIFVVHRRLLRYRF
jgi:SSS family solute:Na+ symporter